MIVYYIVKSFAVYSIVAPSTPESAALRQVPAERQADQLFDPPVAQVVVAKLQPQPEDSVSARHFRHFRCQPAAAREICLGQRQTSRDFFSDFTQCFGQNCSNPRHDHPGD